MNGYKDEFDKIWKLRVHPKLLKYLKRQGLSDEQAGDIVQETAVKTWLWYCENETSGNSCDEETIMKYAFRIAINERNDHFRKAYPKRARLRRSVYAIVCKHPFAVWDVACEKVCGPLYGSIPRLTPQVIDLLNGACGTFKRDQLEGAVFTEEDMSDPMRLAELIAHVFKWVDTPLKLNDLVQILALVMGLKEQEAFSLDALVEDGSGTTWGDIMPDEADDTLEVLMRKETLRHFGKFMMEANLDRCQRFSVLFSCSCGFILDALGLLPSQIAEAIGEPLDKFYRQLWSKLPLTDLEIALYLEGNPQVVDLCDEERKRLQQKVANGRMTTMKRAWPRWLRETNWLGYE